MTLQEACHDARAGQRHGYHSGRHPAAAQQEQVQQLPATALRPKSNTPSRCGTGSPTTRHWWTASAAAAFGRRCWCGVTRCSRGPMRSSPDIQGDGGAGAELATVPCIVAQLSDADADIMMAETNIQRPDWLPSERAKTYKVWLEAVQTETGITQGQRTDTTSGTECPKLGRTEMLPLSVSESAQNAGYVYQAQ